MKLNKKVFIPVLSTALGLSVIGGITGAVAWYQYNSKVNTSFVGASVADTGVLQLGRMQPVFDDQGAEVDLDGDGEQDEAIVWGREYTQPKSDHLIPVTFGAFEEKDVLDENGDPTGAKVNVLPSVAYSYPEAGCGEGYTGHQHTDALGRDCSISGWKVAEKGVDYAEFEVYFRAVQTDSSASQTGGYQQVVRDVFMSDYIFKSVVEDKNAHDALRVYLEINDGVDGAFILANQEYKDGNDPQGAYDPALDQRLPLFGPLNLDRSNETDANPNASENDRYYASLWNDNLASYGNHPSDREGTYDHDNDPTTDEIPVADAPYITGEEIIYGNYGDKQATKNIHNVKVERKADGSMPKSNIQADAEDYAKKLFSTKADGAVKVRVVIWLEGWENMKVNDSGDQAREWNPALSAETAVQVGLQFDTGIFRGDDLNQ